MKDDVKGTVTSIQEVPDADGMIDVTVEYGKGEDVIKVTTRYGGVNANTRQQIEDDIRSQLAVLKARETFKQDLSGLQDIVGSEVSLEVDENPGLDRWLQ